MSCSPPMKIGFTSGLTEGRHGTGTVIIRYTLANRPQVKGVAWGRGRAILAEMQGEGLIPRLFGDGGLTCQASQSETACT